MTGIYRLFWRKNPSDLVWWSKFIIRNVFKAIFTSVRRQWYVSTWGNNLDWCQNQKRKNGRRIKLTPPFTTLWQKVCHVLTQTNCLIYSEFVPNQATARTELCLNLNDKYSTHMNCFCFTWLFGLHSWPRIVSLHSWAYM